jgi:kinetochor protein Mis14/NSL1
MDEVSKINIGIDDVKYLKSELFKAANDKISRDLPVAGSDPLRTRVEQIVSEFIHEGFEMARHSMNINGVDMSKVGSLKELLDDPSEQDTEPFDSGLNEKLRTLYGEVDKKTLEIIQLRRTVPDEAKELYEKVSAQRVEQLQRLIDKGRTLDPVRRVETYPEIQLTAEMKGEFDQIVKELIRLKEEAPSGFEELDKLQATVEHIHSFY